MRQENGPQGKSLNGRKGPENEAVSTPDPRIYSGAEIALYPYSNPGNDTADLMSPEPGEEISRASRPARYQSVKSFVDEADYGEQLFYNEVGAHPLLTHQQEIELSKRVIAGQKAAEQLSSENVSEQERSELLAIIDDSKEASDLFLKSNMRLVISVAKVHVWKGVPLKDLIQEGSIGLMRAIEKYDYKKGFRFSTYAKWWIRKGVVDGSRKLAGVVDFPKYIYDAKKKVDDISNAYAQEHGEKPSIDILKQCFLDGEGREEEFDILMDMLGSGIGRVHSSLDFPITGGYKGREGTLGDLVPDKQVNLEDTVIKKVDKEYLERHIYAVLGEYAASIIIAHYGFNGSVPKTFAEIGEELGLSRQRVHQIESEARMKLRESMEGMAW